MAQQATVHRVRVDLSDVERGVYEALDFRVARHPSETLRFMLTRILAYCLAYEEGIAFSKAGLHESDDPPVAIHDPTGQLLVWIDIGSPAGPRLHKAAKAAKAVRIFTHSDLTALRAEARSIHKAETIAVTTLETPFLDALEARVERQIDLQLMRNDGVLYATLGGETFETSVREDRLLTK